MEQNPGYTGAVPTRPDTAIHTDLQGLDTADVKIPVPDGVMAAYQASPSGVEGAVPVILVVQEIFGLHEYIRDVCRRLAKLGYFALAPDLFARQGDVSQMKDHQEIISKIVSRVPDEQVLSDLDAAAEYAADTGKADVARLGLTGFCWGGRIAWLYAAHNDSLRAAVAWYGRLAHPPSALQPQSPVDLAPRLRCPVLGLYGELDQSIPPEQVERMRQAIHGAAKNVSLVVYPGAGHAFHSDYRPSYEKNAATDGWMRMCEWFREYGVA
jgi:carboxymethylenebutenolidase